MLDGALLLAGGILGFLVIELLLYFLIASLRKEFPWLITTGTDAAPVIDPSVAEKVVRKSFDPELGWVRKPGTTGTEEVGGAGESGAEPRRTAYAIDAQGSRDLPGFAGHPVKISTFGDSFVFARHVEDDQTWQYFLSGRTRTKVLNFGVGNYGIDQGLLRLKREIGKTGCSVALLGGVPETIGRILSVWKHYSEYGNIYAFKPRYHLENGSLSLIPNVIDTEAKVFELNRYLGHFQKYDYWYARKFRRDLLSFPYTISLARSYARNLPLIGRLLRKRWHRWRGGKDARILNRPWESVLLRNNRLIEGLYLGADPYPRDLFKAIAADFKDFCGARGISPVFVFFPYLSDVKTRLETGASYCADFVHELERVVPVIDLLEPMAASPSLWDNYLGDKYGGHLSRQGNELAAEVISARLSEMRLI